MSAQRERHDQPKKIKKRAKAERPVVAPPAYFEDQGLRKVKPYTYARQC
jgi:hypothetical protein